MHLNAEFLWPHQKPDDNYWRLQSVHWICFCEPKSSFSTKSQFFNAILSYFPFSFWSSKCITSVDFQLWSHILWGSTGLHITCWAGVSCRSNILSEKKKTLSGCGGTWTEECVARAHAACSEPTWRRGHQHSSGLELCTMMKNCLSAYPRLCWTPRFLHSCSVMQCVLGTSLARACPMQWYY